MEWARCIALGALVASGGCRQIFGLDSPNMGDGGADALEHDAPLDALPTSFAALHVPPAGQSTGTGALVVTSSIDTTALTVDGLPVPSEITFDMWQQAGGGPELAVLHVRSLAVPLNATVRVTGTRPLVVIAADYVDIDGVLDAGARIDAPGPGGSLPDQGAGKGLRGGHAATYRDSGGSGAGFATAGGTGGLGGGTCSPSAPTVAGGPIYGDAQLAQLVGGSGGGTAYDADCQSNEAGGGGGAIQLSAAIRIAVNGGINVGGGGGGYGEGSATGCNISAGSGGGSGGAIVLQAPRIAVSGTIAANGGGGGSAGGDVNTDSTPPFINGLPGQDGQLGAVPAMGGADVGGFSAAGGTGGARDAPPGNGAPDTECEGNGGGGGGSVGRIVVAVPTAGVVDVSGTASPAQVRINY